VAGARNVDLLYPVKESKALPFNRGLKPLEEFMEKKTGRDA
jgi:hypothetical protein